MFAYCANNSVFFKDDGGTKRIAIIYDNTGGENLFLANYAYKLKEAAESNGDTADLIPVTSIDEFCSQWASLGTGYYDHVDILLHGSPGAIGCGETNNGTMCIGHNPRYYCKYDFDMLDRININEDITLYSCNGGTYIDGGSAGQCLANKAGARVKAISGSKGYFFLNGRFCIGPFPLWGRWNTFSPSKAKSNANSQGGNWRMTA